MFPHRRNSPLLIIRDVGGTRRGQRTRSASTTSSISASTPAGSVWRRGASIIPYRGRTRRLCKLCGHCPSATHQVNDLKNRKNSLLAKGNKKTERHLDNEEQKNERTGSQRAQLKNEIALWAEFSTFDSYSLPTPQSQTSRLLGTWGIENHRRSCGCRRLLTWAQLATQNRETRRRTRFGVRVIDEDVDGSLRLQV